jgi:hypothetical protein
MSGEETPKTTPSEDLKSIDEILKSDGGELGRGWVTTYEGVPLRKGTPISRVIYLLAQLAQVNDGRKVEVAIVEHETLLFAVRRREE